MEYDEKKTESLLVILIYTHLLGNNVEKNGIIVSNIKMIIVFSIKKAIGDQAIKAGKIQFSWNSDYKTVYE